ncbi:hypothetical protein AB0O70_16915 [Microbacterium paraoxydans]|uniref:hypothetical protein n=1 Tax=Microbacterium paraoxydans TaxID=199592 RepID=UPI0034310DA9
MQQTPTARVRQSSHPHQSTEQAALARHIVLDIPLDGRLRREAGDALCRPATDFYELERGDVDGDATCRKCIERAARYGVRVITLAADVAQLHVEADELIADMAEAGADLDELAAEIAQFGADLDAFIEQAPTVHHFDDTTEAYNATQCRDDIHDGDVLVIASESVVGFLRAAWPGAITAAHGELHTFTADPRTIDDGKYAGSVELAEQIARELGAPLPDEQQVVEGVVVEHAGAAEGSLPEHATHPDVVAARSVLAGLPPAAMTVDTDISRYADKVDTSVRGYLIEPRDPGRVAAYWIEGGIFTASNGEPHRAELDTLRARFREAGWTVEPKSLTCVFAWRPAESDADQAEAQQAAPAELPAAVDLDDATCLHGLRPRADVSGDPVTGCARKQPNQSAGVWNDEGCVLAVDCCVEAANDCAQYNVEAEAPADDPEFTWSLMCTEHDEQTADACEECNAVPVEDRCKECSGKGCHWCYFTGEQQPEQAEVDDAAEQDVAEAELADTVEAVAQAEAADGTWRGGWIASTPPASGEALFDLDDGEQGALFN